MGDTPLYLSAVVGLDVGSPQLRMMAYSQESLTKVLDERPSAITVSPPGALVPERLLELLARARSQFQVRFSDSRWRLYCRQPHETGVHFERLIDTHELRRLHMPEFVALSDEVFSQGARLAIQFDSALAQTMVSRGDRDPDEPSAQSLEVQNYNLLKKARAEMLQRVETYTSVELAAISHSSNVNASVFAGDLRKAGKILGVRSGREWLYPRFQFDASLKPVRPFADMKLILAARPADPTGWDHLQWFLDPNPLLNDQAPLEVWNVDRKHVTQAAQKGQPDDRD